MNERDRPSNPRSQFREKLDAVRQYAKQKIAQGDEPPWAWFQYMKLIEIVDTILDATATVIPTGSSQQLDQRPERPLRLVAPTSQRDNVPPHPDSLPTRLPM